MFVSTRKIRFFFCLFLAVSLGGFAYAEMDEMQIKSMEGVATTPQEQALSAPHKLDTTSQKILAAHEKILPDGAVQNVEHEEAVHPVAEMREELAVAAPQYRVGTDDTLRVIVYEEKSLSQTYTVSGNGTISMPLIGDVHVDGLTVSEIESKIEAALSEGYLINPSVSIEISKYRPFYILGEVRTPGSYDFVNDMSVLNAVALAGGFTYRADKKTVEVLRTRESQTNVIKEHPVKEEILPGDIILVRERFF